tara:strand:- start:25 stop:264 length:240 start_codon:yes stop_codon:yes gene_type:complete
LTPYPKIPNKIKHVIILEQAQNSLGIRIIADHTKYGAAISNTIAITTPTINVSIPNYIRVPLGKVYILLQILTYQLDLV